MSKRREVEGVLDCRGKGTMSRQNQQEKRKKIMALAALSALSHSNCRGARKELTSPEKKNERLH